MEKTTVKAFKAVAWHISKTRWWRRKFADENHRGIKKRPRPQPRFTNTLP